MPLWVGVCLWLVTIATYKLLPISTAMVFWLVIVGLSFPVIGLALGLAKRFAARDTARWLDQETGLKERLSTAVELTETEAKGSEWSALVIRASIAASWIEISGGVGLPQPGKEHVAATVVLAPPPPPA